MDCSSSSVISKRRGQVVPVGKEESLLLLRSYQEHPCAWSDIIENMNQNLNHLPEACKKLYEQSSNRKIRERLATKMRKLMEQKAGEMDQEIREEVEKVKRLETRLSQKTPAPGTPGTSSDNVNTKRKRDEIVETLDSDDNANDHDDNPKQRENDLPKAKKEKKEKSKPLLEIARDNQIKYNKFVSKKLPKLLKSFGISSSEEEDDD